VGPESVPCLSPTVTASESNRLDCSDRNLIMEKPNLYIVYRFTYCKYRNFRRTLQLNLFRQLRPGPGVLNQLLTWDDYLRRQLLHSRDVPRTALSFMLAFFFSGVFFRHSPAMVMNFGCGTGRTALYTHCSTQSLVERFFTIHKAPLQCVVYETPLFFGICRACIVSPS